MARTKSRSPVQRHAAKVFPWKVELETPEGGFGHRFREMEDWPRARGLTNWQEKHGPDIQDRWFMYGSTFYFADRETAEAFREAFGGEVSLRTPPS